MTPILIAAPEDIGPLLREMRQARGWSTRDLQKRSGVGQGMISAIENGHRAPHVLRLIWLLGAFECELAFVKRGAA